VKNSSSRVSKVCHRFDPLPQVLKNVRYASGKPLENAKVRSASRGCASPPRRSWSADRALVGHRAGVSAFTWAKARTRCWSEEVVDGSSMRLTNAGLSAVHLAPLSIAMPAIAPSQKGEPAAGGRVLSRAHME